jgi:hypothetical protein
MMLSMMLTISPATLTATTMQLLPLTASTMPTSTTPVTTKLHSTMPVYMTPQTTLVSQTTLLSLTLLPSKTTSAINTFMVSFITQQSTEQRNIQLRHLQ